MVDCTHVLAVLMRVLSIIAAIFIILVNLLVIIFSIDSWPDGFYLAMGKFFNLVIRAFTIVFALFVLMSEFEFKKAFQALSFLEGFIGRGSLMVFVGSLTLAALNGMNINENRNWLEIAVVISGWLMVVIGIIYVFSGCCCAAKLREKRERGNKA